MIDDEACECAVYDDRVIDNSLAPMSPVVLDGEHVTKKALKKAAKAYFRTLKSRYILQQTAEGRKRISVSCQKDHRAQQRRQVSMISQHRYCVTCLTILVDSSKQTTTAKLLKRYMGKDKTVTGISGTVRLPVEEPSFELRRRRQRP